MEKEQIEKINVVQMKNVKDISNVYHKKQIKKIQQQQKKKLKIQEMILIQIFQKKVQQNKQNQTRKKKNNFDYYNKKDRFNHRNLLKEKV